jgi:hypothetical protein
MSVLPGAPSAAAGAAPIPPDFGQWLYQGFCAPGDLALSVLQTHVPAIVDFVALPDTPGSLMAAILAGTLWVCAFIIVLKLCRALHDAYITVIGYLTRAEQATLRVGRNGARRVGIAARTLKRRSDLRIAPTISEEIELGEIEYALLRCHDGSQRGRSLSLDDMAASLGVRVSQVQNALRSLVALEFLDAAESGPRRKRELRYRLTRHGEGFLAACNGMRTEPLPR